MIETKDVVAVMMIDAVDTTTETDMVETEAVDTIEDMMIEEVAMTTGIKVELNVINDTCLVYSGNRVNSNRGHQSST